MPCPRVPPVQAGVSQVPGNPLAKARFLLEKCKGVTVCSTQWQTEVVNGCITQWQIEKPLCMSVSFLSLKVKPSWPEGETTSVRGSLAVL